MSAPGRDSADTARGLQLCGALLLALATIIGAFGAHALKAHLTPDRFDVLQTAVQYQFFHSLGLLAVGLMLERRKARGLMVAGWLLCAGIVLFSGSLYALVAGMPRALGVVTPVGGLMLISAWLLVAYSLYRRESPV